MCFSLCLFMVFQSGLLGAMELELLGGVNGLTFQSEKTARGGHFEPNSFITGKLSFRGEISRAWAYSINVERDNIFQNTLDFRFRTRTDYFGFEFGTFLGLADSFGALEMGILGSLEGIWPGVLFVSIGGTSSVGRSFARTSDNFRESAEVKLGFWLPFAIPTLSAGIKNFTENTDKSSICNSLIRYQLSIEFFGKTLPFAIRVDGGYQTLSRTYSGNTEAADKLNSFFTGLDLQFSVSKHFRFILGGEIPLAVKAKEPLDVSVKPLKMSKVYGGMIIRFY